MRRAAICIAFAAWLAAAFVGSVKNARENAAPMIRPSGSHWILVANGRFDPGEPFTRDKLTRRLFPPNRIPNDALTEFSEVAGCYARQYLSLGEPIVADVVSAANVADIHFGPPRGKWRALGVRIQGPSRLVPGDEVDLYFAGRLVLGSVRVFAIGATGQETRDHKRFVTLLVRPDTIARLGELEVGGIVAVPAEDVSIERPAG